MGPILGALIGLGSSIIHSMVQNRMSKKAWRVQQRYNTPANQMARYNAAGLNPNLIYAQGNSGNAGQAYAQEAPALDAIGPIGKAMALNIATKRYAMMEGQRIMQGQNIALNETRNRLASQELRKNDALIQNIYAKTYNEDIKSLMNRLKSSELEAKLPFVGEQARYSVEVQKARINQMIRDMDVKQASLLNMKLDRQIKDSVLQEKALTIDEGKYYQKIRHNLGIGVNKNDNFLYKGGVTMAQEFLKSWDKYYGN